MFITETFAYLHEPKTGGTFVAAMLARIHEARGDRVDTIWVDPAGALSLPPVERGRAVRMMLTTRNQHGARRHVPTASAALPLLATIRSPYDRYVSQFEFAWWRTDPAMFGDIDDVRQRYPGYPDLAFGEFVELANSRLITYRAPDAEATPGFHVQQFVDFFTTRPDQVLLRYADPAFVRNLKDTELRDVCFVDQANLNAGLHAFLGRMGYPADQIDGVRHAGRVLPPDDRRAAASGVTARDWRSYYTPELKALVRRKERLLFELFPQFDV